MRPWIGACPPALALLAAVLLAACGSEGQGDDGRPMVAATTGVLADVTAQIAGPHAEVEQLVPEGRSPHDFQLSARDRAGVADALLLVANGAELEAGIPLDEIEVERYELADHVPGLLLAGHAHDEEGSAELSEHGGDASAEEEHVAGSVDPHVWMDPSRVAAALPSLAEALAAADPEHAAAYQRRAASYATELAALDREIERELDAVPPARRKLVTSHDAMGYFANRYGFEVVAAPFPTSGAEAEASASRIAEVEDVIRETGVPTVFAEAEDDPEVLRLIAAETGVAVEPGLLVESPGPAGGYEEMLRRDAELIAAGLRAGIRSRP